MNSKLWDIKKGLLFGLGLFFLGMVLQFFFGQVKWNYFESPFNLLALLIFLVLLLLLNI